MEQTEQPSFRRYVEDRRYYEAPARFALHTAYMEVCSTSFTFTFTWSSPTVREDPGNEVDVYFVCLSVRSFDL